MTIPKREPTDDEDDDGMTPDASTCGYTMYTPAPTEPDTANTNGGDVYTTASSHNYIDSYRGFTANDYYYNYIDDYKTRTANNYYNYIDNHKVQAANNYYNYINNHKVQIINNYYNYINNPLAWQHLSNPCKGHRPCHLQKQPGGLYMCDVGKAKAKYHTWLCVEKEGYLGFMHPPSGSYMGHDNNEHMVAEALVHQGWELITVRQHPNGGHLMMMPFWSHALKTVGIDDNGVNVVLRRHGTTTWEFVKV
ncbi:hypothetical protein PT974_03477 [Cladobotryum mycophilum]|uniref:JmjC domain-containing protein n=1 Tax=Cladobotryum mycophilum TaxID=491253 RepID=A0ABR0SSJ8_9HYPO